MNEQELREWTLARYGSATIADDLELARLLREDVATVERDGDFPLDDDLPFDAFMADLNERLQRSSGTGSSLQAEWRKAL
jgi:hypothetical protein